MRCGAAALVDALTRVVLAHAVLHADETPVQMLKPGSGKTHRAYIWAYATGAFEPLRAVVYDFVPAGAVCMRVSSWVSGKGNWSATTMRPTGTCSGTASPKSAVWQHARRKFFELHEASKSTLAATALEFIQKIYEVERLVRDASPLSGCRPVSRPAVLSWTPGMNG